MPLTLCPSVAIMRPAELTYPASLRLLTLDVARGLSFPDAALPPSWNHTDYREVIGHGEQEFRAAAYRLLSWRAHFSAGVRVSMERNGFVEGSSVGGAAVGDKVCVHFGPTRSPCLVIHRELTPTRAVVIYGTLPGHVERGEEAFIVEMDSQGVVTGRCVAFSQHAWWLAKLGSPVARLTQLWITRRYVRGMRPVSGCMQAT